MVLFLEKFKKERFFTFWFAEVVFDLSFSFVSSLKKFFERKHVEERVLFWSVVNWFLKKFLSLEMKTNKREKKEKKGKGGGSGVRRYSCLSGYPSDFPIHLVELCWDEIQTEFESCAIYTSELEMDEALVFGTRVSQKFLQGFPKQLVMKEINRQDPSGFTPLISLTQKSGFLERSKKGGKKGEADRFEYPIHQVAAWFGKHNPVYLLVYLLKHCKAKPNAVDNRGFSPLHHAVASSSPLVVQKLLKEGKPDPNLQNHDGNAPIHLALGCWIKMYLLLEEGALPNIANKQKETPLHLFFTKGMKVKSWKGLPQVCSNDIALLLLRHPKCDPNAQNKDGETALHVLFNSSRASHFVKKSAVVVKEILKRGGDPTIEDHRGKDSLPTRFESF